MGFSVRLNLRYTNHDVVRVAIFVGVSVFEI